MLELLQTAGSLRFEAWRGRFGLISDIYYVNLGAKSNIGLPGPARGNLGVDVDIRQGWVSLQGAYRFAEGVTANNRPYAFDANIGVRWNSLRQEVDAKLDTDIGMSPGKQTTLGGTESWFEPVIGLRGTTQIADRWAFAARADIGGFGVNGSDLQWLALAGFDWQAWEKVSLRFGYQAYGIDYSKTRDDGKFAYDVVQHGPYLGLSFRF